MSHYSEQMRRSGFKYFLPLLCFLSLPLSAEPKTRSTISHSYKVLKIIDGDTFDATDGTIRFRIRIAGIDAPEIGTPFSKLAIVELKKMIEGKKVEIKSVGRGLDRYNRILGHVFVDHHDIGIEMIEKGLATYYRPGCVDYPANKKSYDYDPRPYVAAEERARGKKLYLWSDPKTVLPCKIRKETSGSSA